MSGFDQSYQAPVYSGSLPVVKKRINPLAIIIPAAVLLIAAAVILIFVLFNKPNYRKAEENFFNSTFGTARSSADNAASKLKTRAECLKIKFDSPLGSLDVPSFSASIDAVPNGDNAYTEIAFSMDDIDLAVQGWIDSAAQAMYFYFPEISDIYAKYDIGKMMSQLSQQSAASNLDYEKYSGAMESICKTLSDKYFEFVGEPEVDKNQSFTLEGETYKADKCIVKLDSKQIVQLIKTFFEAVSENDEMIEFIAEASNGEYSVSEIKDELNQMLISFDSGLNEIGENDFGLEMNVYMRRNSIIGREIKIKVSGLSAVKLSFYDIPTSGGRVVAFKTGSDLLSLMGSMNSSMSASGDGAAMIPMSSIAGGSIDSGTAAFALLDTTFILVDNSKGDVHSGTASLKMGTLFTAEFKYDDLALTEDLCQGSGSLTVSNMPGFGADLELSKDGDNKIIRLDITNVCTITVTEGPSDLQYKELPNIPDDKIAEIDPEAMEDDEIVQQLIEDLNRAFGVYNNY